MSETGCHGSCGGGTSCSSAALLSDEEIRVALERHPGWQREGDRLIRRIKFSSHSEAMMFILVVGMMSDKMDHHAELDGCHREWSFTLSTHSVGNRITQKDTDFMDGFERLKKELLPF